MKRFNAILTMGLLGGLATAPGQLEIKPGTTLDLGRFPADAAPVATFELINTGTVPIRIIKTYADCHCIDPVVYEKSIPPSGSIPLDVFINGNLIFGSFSKPIQLRINAPNPTNIELSVKGIAQHAISGIPKFIFSGLTPLNQPWSTNLLLNIRSDLSEKPQLRIEGRSPLVGELLPAPNAKQIQLKLYMPPQKKNLRWENKIILSFSNHPAIPKQVIAINGCCGGTLIPSVHKLKVSTKGTSFILQRTYPNGVPPRPTPLSCPTPGIFFQETPLPEFGKSTVHLSFSNNFLLQLKKEGRIAIQLFTKGFVPTNLVLESQ